MIRKVFRAKNPSGVDLYNTATLFAGLVRRSASEDSGQFLPLAFWCSIGGNGKPIQVAL